ncbi:MAG TPA: heavy metal translocating P-type ATPase [Longimicrobiales bacterium]
MKAPALLRAILGRGVQTAEDREAVYHLRVTIIVAIALITGAVLGWMGGRLDPWRWLPFGIAYLVGGWRIALDGWADLKHARLNIDFLMGAAAVGAAIVGAPLEGVILIFLFSLSKALEAYAMGRTRHAIARLMDLRPDEATLADADGREIGRIAVDDLAPGQLILVRPGERIAGDGRVRSGRTEIDQSAITGEAMPVRKAVGDDVYAGTINQGGAIVVEVTKATLETMLAKIIRLVEEAREERAPAQHFIDRFAHPYTVGVVAATALAAIVPPLVWNATWNESFYRAMTLLVVASPCALVISTPSAILSGIANGARHGILFKGGAFLDLAGTIDTIAFDKTGTLTVGKPRLVDVVSRAELGGDVTVAAANGDELLRLAAAVEQVSEHHLARAVVEEARDRELVVAQPEEFESFPGEGVNALVEGAHVWVGNATMAARQSARLGPLILGWTAEQTSRGRSVVYVGIEDEVQGGMSFGDELKPGVAASVRHLKYEGVRWITVLSGDHPDAVRAIAAEIGADEVKAGLLPHEKVEAVKQLVQSSNGVAMVGDGVNDAPAMATATIGIAMGAVGTDVAIETADVVLMSDDVEKIDYVIHLGKRARRVVRQNVYFSIGWMAFLVILALTVGIPLPLAVVGHEGSTLLVAANGLRLLGGKPHPPVVPSHPGGRHPGGRGTRIPKRLVRT